MFLNPFWFASIFRTHPVLRGIYHLWKAGSSFSRALRGKR